jgi:RES domain-containing protein
LITSWRIVATEHASTAFTGDGASAHPGRWNAAGLRVIYTASSAALAALELLVHMDSAAALRTFVLYACTFEDSLVSSLDISRLPANWQIDPPPASARAPGVEWLRDGATAVLRVPSAIVPTEANYLLNPAHADFVKIAIADPVPFALDLRLLRRR